jgi:hypothetical protein
MKPAHMAPVTHIYAEVRIKASAVDTWAYLIDTSTWPSWNTFVSEAQLVDKADEVDGASTRLKEGSRRRFMADMKGRKWPSKQRVTTLVEASTTNNAEPNEKNRIWRVNWVVEGYPNWLFNTLRCNEIEEVVPEEGEETECIYRTWEDQSGPVAHMVKMMFGNDVKKGINNWANDLKRIAEG